MIKNFLDKQKGEKILCGDFNLDINTKSLAMLEKGMVNLIKEYRIPTTRNKLAVRFDQTIDKFADYILVSHRVKALDFQVPQLEVSDHLPMILIFE